MDAIGTAIGLQPGELTQLLIIAVVLLIGLFLARLAFKITASLMRIGCLAIFFIVAAVFLVQLFSN